MSRTILDGPNVFYGDGYVDRRIGYSGGLWKIEVTPGGRRFYKKKEDNPGGLSSIRSVLGVRGI